MGFFSKLKGYFSTEVDESKNIDNLSDDELESKLQELEQMTGGQKKRNAHKKKSFDETDDESDEPLLDEQDEHLESEEQEGDSEEDDYLLKQADKMIGDLEVRETTKDKLDRRKEAKLKEREEREAKRYDKTASDIQGGIKKKVNGWIAKLFMLSCKSFIELAFFAIFSWENRS